MFNLVDAIILAVLAAYIVRGLFESLYRLLIELLGFITAASAALALYPMLSAELVETFGLSSSLAPPIAFITIWLIAESLFIFGAHFLFDRLPKIKSAKLEKALTVIPSSAKAVIVIIFAVAIITSLPVTGPTKDSIINSASGKSILKLSARVENLFDRVFGAAVKDALNFLTVKPESDERVDLGFTVKEPSVDEASEQAMLTLVNRERTSRGLQPLALEISVRAVARAHSLDMFVRGYFSHNNPDGEDPCDRLTRGGVEWRVCGENLALAPDVELAHQGLMNSPGHRANILDPRFNKIGIGVMDGGNRGKMFTQNFID